MQPDRISLGFRHCTRHVRGVGLASEEIFDCPCDRKAPRSRLGTQLVHSEHLLNQQVAEENQGGGRGFRRRIRNRLGEPREGVFFTLPEGAGGPRSSHRWAPDAEPKDAVQESSRSMSQWECLAPRELFLVLHSATRVLGGLGDPDLQLGL